MALPLIRPEVLNKTSNQIGEPISIGYRGLRWISVVCASTLVAALIVVCVLPYSRKLHASGVIVVSDGVERISSPQSGILTRALIDDGHLVKKGDPLFEISSDVNLSARKSAADSALEALKQRRQIALSQLAEGKSDSDTKLRSLLGQAEQRRQEIQHIDAEIQLQQERIKTAQDELGRQENLVSRGFFSRSALTARRDALLGLRQQFSELSRTRADREAELLGIRISVDDLANKAKQAKLAAEDTLQNLELEEQANQAKQRIVVTSPRTGVFQGVATLPGSYIAGGQNLGAVVEDHEAAYVDVFVPSSANAFPRPGMSVSLSVKAFPYERYGLLQGQVMSVSSVGLPGRELSHIPIHLEPDQIYFQVRVKLLNIAASLPGKLVSGMAVDSVIRIETKPLIRWLLGTVPAAARGVTQ